MTEIVKELPEIDEELENTIETEGDKRLTPAQWAEIREHYELGTLDGPEICERYGIKPATLKKRLLRYGVKKGSRKAEIAAATGAAVTKAAVSAAVSAVPAPPVKSAEDIAAERKSRIETVRAQGFEWTQTLMKAAMGRLAAAQRDGRPFSTEDGNLKAIERTMKIIRAGREEAWDLLGAHDEIDDKELPELTIRNLTDQQIKALREKQEEEDGDLVEDGDAALTADDDDAIVVEEDGNGAA